MKSVPTESTELRRNFRASRFGKAAPTKGYAVPDPVRRLLAPRIWAAGVIIGCAGLLSANPMLTFFGALVPACLFAILWRTGEPAVLLFIAMYQWLQASAPAMMANVEGLELMQRFGGPEIETAAWLSLTGVLCLAAGMRFFPSRQRARSAARMSSLAGALDARRLLAAYFIAMVVTLVARPLGERVPAANQLLAVLLLVKWTPLFLLAWITFQRRRAYAWLAAAVGCEIVLGFTGYFSGFKNVLFLLLVVATGAPMQAAALPSRRILSVVGATLGLCMLWQGIKSDFRGVLRQGSNEQDELASYSDRFGHLGHAIPNLTSQGLLDGLLDGVNRVGYLDFFAHSIRNVPARIPYQNGDLWLEAIKHVMIPRALAPGKKNVNDSERTSRFTLRNVAGVDRGTSISIGYMGESYIDFGPVGMFVPIFLLGLCYGWIYRWFVIRAPNPLLGLAIATPLLLFSAMLLETSNIKMVGGITSGFLVLAVLQAIVGARFWSLVCRPSARPCS